MKNKVLDLLKNSKEDFVSGEYISNILGVSRAAVWKHMNALKEDGYNIESIPKRGYRLIMSPDVLTFDEIKGYLTTSYIGQTIMHFDELDSTNNYAKKVADNLSGEGQVIITEKQLTGRGRLGRTFFSQNERGIWFTIILRPKINIFEVSKVTQVAAAAVNRALNDIGIKSQIKWPNDVIINDKKVCGILTEMNSEINIVNYVIVGIGINANSELSDFTEDIRNIASSLYIETGNKVKRNELIAKVLNHFEKLYDAFNNGDFDKTLQICREDSYILGKQINVIRAGNIREATAVDIDKNGELIVRYEDGTIENVVSGEVSVRLNR